MAWLSEPTVMGVLFRAGGIALLVVGLLLLTKRKSRLDPYVKASAFLLVLAYATWELALAFDGANNGRVAGHESIAVAMLWSAYGAATILWLPRIRHPWALGAGQILVLLGLGWLLFGGLMANARWALVWVRIAGYSVVFGAIWGVEALLERRARVSAAPYTLGHAVGIPARVRAPTVRPADRTSAAAAAPDDVQGMLSVVAVLAGALVVVPFEVERSMETLFDLYGVGRIAHWYLATQTYVTAVGWSLYGLLTAGAGLAVRSYRTWLLGLTTYAGAAGYFLLFGVTRTEGLDWMRTAVWVLLPAGAVLLSLLWWWGRPAHRSLERSVATRFEARS